MTTVSIFKVVKNQIHFQPPPAYVEVVSYSSNAPNHINMNNTHIGMNNNPIRPEVLHQIIEEQSKIISNINQMLEDQNQYILKLKKKYEEKRGSLIVLSCLFFFILIFVICVSAKIK